MTAVRDVSKQKLYIYANGVLEAEGDDLTSNIAEDEDLYFGYAVNFPSYHDGYLDEIRLYNYALDTSEIKLIMKNESPVITAKRFATSGNGLEVFPNPASQFLHIGISAQAQIIMTSLYDNTGRMVLNYQPKDIIAESNRFTLDISGLKMGLYFLEVFTDKGTETSKVIIGK